MFHVLTYGTGVAWYHYIIKDLKEVTVDGGRELHGKMCFFMRGTNKQYGDPPYPIRLGLVEECTYKTEFPTFEEALKSLFIEAL